MYIESIELKNFRNYQDLQLDFDKGTNIFYGDNAQGKTNILEAIYMCAAAKLIYTMGCKAVLVKGGHFAGDPIDILFDGEQHISFTANRIQTKNTHGTGCTLSSAIASNLALGYAPAEAVKRAKDYMTCALELGHGAGPTNHFYSLYQSGLPK